MKVYKTKDAILRHAPHLDAEDEKLLNSECFTPYIFFKDDRKNKRREVTAPPAERSSKRILLNE